MDNADDILYRQFQGIFQQHYNALCNYAYTFLKDLSSSEDVVQEIFISIWEKRKDLISSKTIRYYLFTAVRNNCITLSNQYKKNRVVELDRLDGAAVQTLPGEDDVWETDFKKELKNAMNHLPPKCREVFVLSRLSKQSYKEISETMDISVKTVENQMGKALKILRDYVKKRNLFLFLLVSMIIYFFGALE